MRGRLACLGVLLTPVVAHANAFDLFGAGARSQGMAGAAAATTADFTAAWHNPAALATAETSVGLGVTAAFDRSTVLLYDRPQGYDPPGYGDRPRTRADTDELRTTTALAVGLSFPLLFDDLRVGALMLAPFTGFGHVSTHFADEREQHFSNQLGHELLGERLKSEVIAGSLAYRIGDWLSLGIGLTILPDNATQAVIYTPNPADPAEIEANTDVDQDWTKALMVGVLVEPFDWLRVGAVFHDEDFFRLRIRSDVRLEGSDQEPFTQAIDHVVHYSPPRFRLGVAAVLQELTASVEGTYRAWSRLRDHHAVNAGFEDTFDVAGGVEYAATGDTYVRAGVGWHPSPVAEQEGRTNYVDNDRLVLALGAGRRVAGHFVVDVGVQIHALLQQDVYKRRPAGGFPDCAPGVTTVCDELPDRDTDRGGIPAEATQGLQTGNPGFPGYSSGGYVLSTSLDVRYLF